MTLPHISRIPELLFDTADSGGGAADTGDELSQDLADLEDTNNEGDEGDEGDDAGDDSEGAEGDGEEGEEGQEGEEEEEVDEEDGEEEEEDGEKKGKKKKDEPLTDENGRPTVKAIKAKYPDLFKDFPSLRAAFFDYPKFLEVFPDPATAQEASEKAGEFDQLEASLVGKGDPSLLVKTLEENSPKALAKIVENFGEAVRSINQDLYMKLATPIVEELLYHASAHGKKTGNKNLDLAARHLANFVFANGGEVPDISKRAKGKNEPSEAEIELQRERDSNNQREFVRSLKEVADKSLSDITPIISSKLDGLTPFEKKQVIKETRAELDSKLSADSAFQKTLKALWRKAAEDGYSEVTKSRIRRAWLDRAKALAPAIRNRLRQEALNGRKEGTPNESDSNRPGKKRQFGNQGGVNRGKREVLDPHKIDWRKTSDMDILNS